MVSSLPILIPSISFSSLIATGSVTSTMLNNRGDNGHPYFTPDVIGNPSNSSPLQMMLVDGLDLLLKLYYFRGQLGTSVD